MIHVIDYNIGNIGSVVNMLRHIGADVHIATKPDDLIHAEKIILPGVGSFDAGVAALHRLGFAEAIQKAVHEQKAYLLGICLGMQLLMEFSEEGDSPGLGLVPGHVKKFLAEHKAMRIPHMGWNNVEPINKGRLLNHAQGDEYRFYFVHSYFVHCTNTQDTVGLTTYGSKFTSILEHDRIMGVQFHPEKSHRFGKELFKNFVAA